MDVELQINNSLDPGARFVTWAPSPCRIRVTNPAGATAPTVDVRITGRSAASAGAVVFRAGTTGQFSDSLSLTVPTNGTSVSFFTAGKFGRPSLANGDVTVEARAGNTLLGSVPVMVRVRKNANKLTPDERDLFVYAYARLNNQGAGRFADFRDMHREDGDREAHRGPGFLPWHRAYLLDLERELQAIEPSVALPYWRFDEPAPKVFTLDFMGVSDSNGSVQFSGANPLRFWTTDGVLGVDRTPRFNTSMAPPGVFSEDATFNLGGQGGLYRLFRAMQFNPHGSAHVSFVGSLDNPATAPKDPLFFLLHCNVDRLWAKWQRKFGRFDATQASAFDTNSQNTVGHRLPDTMWPWNGDINFPRPPAAPGGPLAGSPSVSAPGPQPRVQDSLDYQGSVNAISRMGFDYDDVEFA